MEGAYYSDIFQPALEAFKKRHLPYDADDPPVLHKTAIISAAGPFRVLQDAARRRAFDDDLMQFVQSAEFCFFCVVVDKRANRQRYGSNCPDQYGYAMAGLLARYCGWLNYVASGVGDVMAEARSPGEDQGLKRVFTAVWQYGTQLYPGPTPVSEQVFQTFLTSKQLKLKEKKYNIAGLQLADLLTFCGKVDVLRTYGRPAPKLGPYSAKIRRIIQPRYNRRIADGTVKGYGKILIAPK